MKFEGSVSVVLQTLAVGGLWTGGLCSSVLAEGGSGFVAIPTVGSPGQPVEGGIAGAGCEYAVDDGTGEQNVGFGGAGLQGTANLFVIDASCTTLDSVNVAWGPLNTSAGTTCTVSIYDDPNNDGDPSDAVLLGSGTGVTANEGTNTLNTYALDAPVEVSGLFFVAAVAQVAGTDPNGDGNTGDGDFPMRQDTATDAGVSYFLGNIGDALNVFNSGGAVGINSTFGAFAGNVMVRAGGTGVDLCPTDIDGNGATDVDDLVAVILEWNCMGSCTADVNGDMMVNVDDLVAVILAWGPCPIANDACGDAIFSLTGSGTVFVGEITCDPVSIAFNNTGASLDGGAFECDETATADVWYEATFNCTGLAIIDTNGSEFDTVLEVYDACGGTLLGCDNDSGDDGLDSRLELAVEPGTSLKIRVGGGALGPEGAGVLRLCCAENLPDAPLNDNCADAEPLAVGGSDTEQTITATADPEAFPCGITVDGPGVWYAVTGTGNTMTASLCTDTDYDGKIFVYCGPCEELACIGGDDDGCGTVGGPSEISWCSEAGRAYLVYVSGFGGATGNFTISLADDGTGCGTPDECTPNALPANDECIDATPISNGLTAYSTLQATTSDVAAHDECQYDGLTVHDIWFTYTVDCPAEDGVLTLSTCDDVGADGGFDTDIVAYDATDGIEAACADLASRVIGCNDDNCPIGAPAAPWYSHVEIPVTNGQQLLIRLGGFGTEGLDLGEGTLLIDCVAADSDLCNFAEVADLSSGSASIQVDNCTATVDDLAPICGSSAPDAPGRWIAFEGNGSTIQIELCNTSNPGAENNDFIDTRMNVYCGGFGQPSCSDLSCAVEEDVDNGNCPFTEITSICTVQGYWYVVLVQGTGDFGGGCEGLVDVTFTELVSCDQPQCVQVGLCCLDNGASCTDDVVDDSCLQMGGDFVANASCADFICFQPCKSFSTTLTQNTGTVEPLTQRATTCRYVVDGRPQTFNNYFRTYTAADGLTSGFEVCSISVGIRFAQFNNAGEAGVPIRVRLYDIPVVEGSPMAESPFIDREFIVLESQITPVDAPCDVDTDADQEFDCQEDGLPGGSILTFEVGGTVTSGFLTVEVQVPDAGAAPYDILWLAGHDGSTAPSYFASQCGGTENPTSFGSINQAFRGLVIDVNGNP